MAIVPALLTASVQLGATAASIYTTPAQGQTLIKRAVFTNVDTSPRTITVHRVPVSGSASNANRVISSFRLSPGQSYVAVELANMVLNAGDSIQAFADTANLVNVTMSGFAL
ncbi:hypothetical protein UFOVP1414_65 [uncultured Caudovirales phage]|uniref:Uncharacterized protein n=1 Tax=uncultured Caudovirales phage TaxID=2100421 RepID=A0A6J5SDK1_9CAUD|nr:hypothetical protein UFOVP442_12 [uncultured Caudovirales phage]CAB4211969.1 hypothetical protein UFOVP1414_65 [uncultured Caudovirales phage]